MTDEDFFAQFDEEVPEWAKQPPIPEPQVQDDGFPGLVEGDLEDDLEEELEVQIEAELAAQIDFELLGPAGYGSMDTFEGDLEAQLDTELGAANGNGSMGISEGDLEAQLDAELAAGDNDGPMELLEDDLEAQLNAELEAEANQEQAAEAARREANLREEMRIAAEKAALAVPFNQRGGLPSSSEDELQAELSAGEASDGLLDALNDRIAVMSKRKSKVNCQTVKQWSYRRPTKRAKMSPKTSPEARVARGQPPPMRKTDELPELYHHGEPNWDLLRKHMNLSMFHHAPF